MPNTTQLHDTSFRTVQTHTNDTNADAWAWGALLSGEGFDHRIDGPHPRMEQTETTKVPESMRQVNNTVSRNRNMDEMIAARTACTTERIVA